MWNDSIPDLVDELFDEPGPHGEPRETALMTHIAGELVHEDQLTEARDGTMPPRKTDYTTAQKLLTISIEVTDNVSLATRQTLLQKRLPVVRSRD